ncbi:MAG: single-stranded-DNA-specific exonuclease RecJ [Verrucomicrobiota bacterium]
MAAQAAKWVIRERPDREKAEEIAQEFGLRPLIAELLLQRGFTESADIAEFLHPRLSDLSDPFLLPNLDVAVERVFKAIDEKESVVLYGDYDVDGVTSLTLLHGVLNAYGLNAHTFLPHRMDEGYGLSDQGVERCLTDFKPSLIIAVDCGTSSIETVTKLRDAGIDVVILDHHEASPDGQPPAVALVNPKLGDDYHYLCSVGVVFKLAHGMLKQRRIDLDLRDWMDIIALGTVADLVPLVDENRTFVRKGLEQLERSQRPGISQLKMVAGISGRVQSFDIGFKLGPRLNAAGRLDTAQASLDLLVCEDEHQARVRAQFLDNQNRSRQELEGRIKDEALEMLERFNPKRETGIVLGSADWHPGVVGIVASRVSKEFHRPTFIIAIDENGVGKGSGRSVEGVSLVAAIEACRDVLEAGGGHEMAAGLSVRGENIDEFRERFCSYIAETIDPQLLRPKLDIDLVATFDQLNFDLLDSYELVHPLGMGNPSPLFASRGVHVVEAPRIIKDKHLRLRMYQNGREIEAMYFNAAQKELPRLPWDVAYRIDRNVYRGRVSLGVTVEAIRAAQ